ncbi:MBL fold metallo-hydrolase [Brevibacillus dissolubilis]|uniref:MBL fold metallo-hydrolase n=1 Tax=Brevibacillus dissolubilis TaxID=1844116 RepID=UPI0011164367|nr:MBL fold metallo-hydrolase [Brevibacillus dissolubilis]
MQPTQPPIDLGHNIFLLDLYDLGMEGRTGCFVFREEDVTIVETSASPSIPHLVKGLEQLGIQPNEIKNIIVTHIHLDHAGGVGLLLQQCPDARVIVHPKGERHLANPERLIAGAKAVYGDDFDRLFDPILPVPQERLVTKADGETLQIGPGRTLRFLDTPGHANHHFSIYDPISNGVFSGDTYGMQYHQAEDCGLATFYLPSTSPNQFNPEAMLKSMERMRALGIERIYFGHYGMTTQVDEADEQLRYWIPIFVETAKRCLVQGGGVSEITDSLLLQVRKYLGQRGVPGDHPVFGILSLDIEVSAMGLADYLSKE